MAFRCLYMVFAWGLVLHIVVGSKSTFHTRGWWETLNPIDLFSFLCTIRTSWVFLKLRSLSSVSSVIQWNHLAICSKTTTSHFRSLWASLLNMSSKSTTVIASEGSKQSQISYGVPDTYPFTRPNWLIGIVSMVPRRWHWSTTPVRRNRLHQPQKILDKVPCHLPTAPLQVQSISPTLEHSSPTLHLLQVSLPVTSKVSLALVPLF